MTDARARCRVVFRVLGSDVAVLNLVTAEMEALGAPLAHTCELTTHASVDAARGVDGVIDSRADGAPADVNDHGTLVVAAVDEWEHERAVASARELFCRAAARARARIASIEYTLS